MYLVFSDAKLIVDFVMSQITNCFNVVWSHGGWLGVGIICLGLTARLIQVFKKIFL